MSSLAQDLIDKLLALDPQKRLGTESAKEVKNHPFFSDINWDTLLDEHGAFIPKPKDGTDTTYFWGNSASLLSL